MRKYAASLIYVETPDPGGKLEYHHAENTVNPLDMQEMMQQARQMQDQMKEKLNQTVVEASAGGGAVTIKMNGQKQVLQLKIDAAAMASLSSSPSDVEMLEDLLTAAFNEAGRRADDAMKSNLTGMLGGLNLPPGLL
jgi:DNA-binding YbaB/EbfC family protein